MDLFAPHGAIKSILWSACRKNISILSVSSQRSNFWICEVVNLNIIFSVYVWKSHVSKIWKNKHHYSSWFSKLNFDPAAERITFYLVRFLWDEDLALKIMTNRGLSMNLYFGVWVVFWLKYPTYTYIDIT